MRHALESNRLEVDVLRSSPYEFLETSKPIAEVTVPAEVLSAGRVESRRILVVDLPSVPGWLDLLPGGSGASGLMDLVIPKREIEFTIDPGLAK